MQRAPSDYDPSLQSGLLAATAVLECLPLPILVLDQQGRIRFANAPIVHLFGYARVELINKPASLLFPACRFNRPAEATLRLQAAHKDGTRFACCLKFASLENSQEPYSVCIVQEDGGTGIENLALTQTRLNEAQRTAKIGSWTWDVPSNTHWWSDELYRVLGVEPDTEEQP
jgi:PAS domain S-box-containing protein